MYLEKLPSLSSLEPSRRLTWGQMLQFVWNDWLGTPWAFVA